MEMLFLGTAGGEGWPAPYCDCAHCADARRLGGANLRLRASVLVDEDLKIDHGADTVAQMQRAGRSLTGLKTLLITHPHPDHLIQQELLWTIPPFTGTPFAAPLDIYGSAQVLDRIRADTDIYPLVMERLRLHLLEPLRAATTAQDDIIMPLPARHSVGAQVLRITRGGRTFLYGYDSGHFPPETIEALASGPVLDVALLECTLGRDSTYQNHLGVDSLLALTKELRRCGAVTDATRVIATHFSHNGGLLHDELVRILLPHGIEVAFDGMLVRL